MSAAHRHPGHRDHTNSHSQACLIAPTTAPGHREFANHHPAIEIATYRRTDASNCMIAPAFPGHREFANNVTRYNVVP